MKARLAITGDDKLAREFPINGSVEIGRVGDNWEVALRTEGHQVLIGAQDASVSKRHAMIYTESGKLLIKDLGSSNGTMLNHRLLPNWRRKTGSDPAEIKNDSIIRLGNTEIEIKVEAAPVLEELARMMGSLELESTLKGRHSAADAQKLANSFRVILDINNNCCNTRTRVKELNSRLDTLKTYLTDQEFLTQVADIQRRIAAALYEDEFLAEDHVRDLKEFCTRFTELWNAKFM